MSSRIFASFILITAAALCQQIPVEGRADSAVRVLIFEDLQCPDCAEFRRMMDEKLLPQFGRRVAFVHRDFPLARHTWARQAAVAARYLAADKPELSLGFRRDTFARIREINKSGFPAHLKDFALRHGVDPADWTAALSDERLNALVEKDFQEGVARGVSRTPTVFVSGQPFIETFTFAEIASAIEQALKENP